MQDIIDRAVEAEAKLLDIPVAGPVMAAAQWVGAAANLAHAFQFDTATTDELLAEAASFRPDDKHFVWRAQLQFARLAKARREGR